MTQATERCVGPAAALREHWPEYLIEAWALGMFMLSASVFSTLFGSPESPLHSLIPNEDLRRALVGIAMGATAVTLIYSPWGKRSGAHMNPAVTMTFWRLGKVASWDAAFYILAQFFGATLGVLIAAAVLRDAFTGAPIRFVATLPGKYGATGAFVAEFIISALLMWMILRVSNAPRYAKFTGLGAGVMLAIYITFEAPLSGMSMNPARSFGSAYPAGLWRDLWLYFTAPVLGMQTAAAWYVFSHGKEAVDCAKLRHTADQRCIHCGHVPIVPQKCRSETPGTLS